MTIAYLLLFLAGAFGANGVPHFVKGITGEQHQTPFRNPSSPQLNIIWGTINFLVAAWLVYLAQRQDLAFGASSIAVVLGILTAGMLLATLWNNNPHSKGKGGT